MSDHFVTLKCPQCGGSLQIYDDMENFACGYCGTNMVTQRRGGTVLLKAVADAIRNVQVGTDKTAAELAILRLNGELEELIQRQNNLDIHKDDGQMGAVLGLVFLGASVVVAFKFSLAEEWYWILILSVVGLRLLINGVLRDKQNKKKRDRLNSEIERTIQRLQENKRIVDG